MQRKNKKKTKLIGCGKNITILKENYIKCRVRQKKKIAVKHTCLNAKINPFGKEGEERKIVAVN